MNPSVSGLGFLAGYIVMVGVASFPSKVQYETSEPVSGELPHGNRYGSLAAPTKALPLGAPIGLLMALGSICFLLSLAKLPVGMATAISTSYVVLVIFLSWLFINESISLMKIEGVRDAVEHFVTSVSPGDEIFLVRFSDDAEIVQDFTDDRRRILRAVENLEPQGSTALYEALVLGPQRVAEGRHRKRALLLLTDGNDTSSSTKFDAVLALARRSEVLIYALGIGHGEFAQLATGGYGSGSRS